MASIEERLVTRLSAQTSAAAVRPTKLNQGDTGGVTWRRVSALRDSAMNVDTGHVTKRFQVTSWAGTYTAAHALAKEVRQALQRWSSSTATQEVLDTFIVSELDVWQDGSDLYRIDQDYMIHHKE